MIEYISLSSKVVKTMIAEICRWDSVETGGVLLGKVDGNRITVEKATLPGPKAIHEPIYFEVDHDYTQMLIDIEYANSKGKTVYLGEWHSHPEYYPHPSKRDIEALFSIGLDPLCNTPSPVLLLVGSLRLGRKNFPKKSRAILFDSGSEKLSQPQITVNSQI